MLAEEVKRGGVLKGCNSADSRGGGRGDSFATTQALSFTSHLGQFQTSPSTQTSSISLTLITNGGEVLHICSVTISLFFAALLHSVRLLLK